jgi:DNA-binding MarR family transcriptional regulator
MQATGTATPSRTEAAVEDTARRLNAFLRHLFLFDRGAQLRTMEESGLSLTQTKVLAALTAPTGGEDDGSCPGRQLAERVGISEATVSRAVDGLVERGYVSRVEDPTDRRVRRVAITEQGGEAVGRIASARMEGLRAFSAGLSTKERRKLDAALNELFERDELAALYAQTQETDEE